MTVIIVLDETGRERQLADQITGMLEDTAELVSDITALTPPSVLRFRLLSPSAWRAESRAYVRRQIEASFARSAPSPTEEAEAQKKEITYRASTLAGWWMTEGRTMLDSAGEPQSLVAPKALHHTGLRYASNQLYRFVVHEAVHQWQISSSNPAIMPIPMLGRDTTAPHQGLIHLAEGHADWVMEEVARRLFGPDTPPAADLRRSWRFRGQTAVMKWMARTVANAEAVEQAEAQTRRIRSQGRHWVEIAIKGAGGVIPFNRVWQDVRYVPTADEVSYPDKWLGRVGL
ncbi:zinc-dependent metalloprotease [Streptomyces sp. NPDC056669]|uniref:zinc-dependent metalloprotease n=1 Tax=unclassified Streptomyces TaxID=2593676 RepID=UPI00365B1B4C